MKRYFKFIASITLLLVMMINISSPVFANSQTQEGLLLAVENVDYIQGEEEVLDVGLLTEIKDVEDGTEEVIIQESMIPMGAFDSSYSVLNVSFVALTVIASLAFIIKGKKMFAVKMINIVFSSLVLILFFETEMLGGMMKFADSYTVLYTILTLANMAVLFAATRQELQYEKINE